TKSVPDEAQTTTARYARVRRSRGQRNAEQGPLWGCDREAGRERIDAGPTRLFGVRSPNKVGAPLPPSDAPACGDATRERDVSASAISHSCAHLRGRIPKGAPAPRFGANTWRGFGTQHGV